MDTVITAADVYTFTMGACHVLAVDIHNITGWPVCAFWDRGDYDVHAFVETPSGTYLDIEGEHSEDDMLDRWECYEIRRVRKLPFQPSWFDEISGWRNCVVRSKELAPLVIAMYRESEQP